MPPEENRSPSRSVFSDLESCMDEQQASEYADWKEKRHRMFMYWCFVHFIHGMVHSIRYSSQYLYFKDVMKVSNPDFLYGLSVSLIGATGVVFPLIISPYVDRTRNIWFAIMIVNVCGVIGNLLYALPFTPVLVLIGQLVAGTTPAFGVLAMGEISRTYSAEKLTKKVSVLSWIYSVGTFTSIGLVFSFLYIDFWIGYWHINFAVMPGIFMAFAFLMSAASSCILVTDVSKEFDLKLEERIKRSSCGSSPILRSSAEPSPEPSDSNRSSPQLPIGSAKMPIPTIVETKISSDEEDNSYSVVREVGESFYISENNQTLMAGPTPASTPGTISPGSSLLTADRFGLPIVNDVSDSEDDSDDDKLTEKRSLLSSASHIKSETCDAAKDTMKWVFKILRHRTTALLMFVTFIEAFIYSMIVTSLPVLAATYLGWGKVELALLSMVNKFLSVLISGSVYFLADHLADFLLLVYGIELSLVALLSLSVLELVETSRLGVTIMLFVVAALSIAGIPLIITSTRSMLAKIVPSEIQSLTEAVRMSVFEASFVPAGFLVPLVRLNLPATGISLLLISTIVVILAVLDRNSLINPQEEDDYWWQSEDPARRTPPSPRKSFSPPSSKPASSPAQLTRKLSPNQAINKNENNTLRKHMKLNSSSK